MSKAQGFTLVELLIVLAMTILMLLLIPATTHFTTQSFEQRLFFREFENQFKVAQTCALATGKISIVTFLGVPTNQVRFRVLGDERLSTNLDAPEGIVVAQTFDIVLKRGTGATNKFRNIVFLVNQDRYIYHFQLWSGKFYVEIDKRK